MREQRKLGEWLERRGAELLTVRGNQCIDDHSRKKEWSYPDQRWYSPKTKHVIFLEWKAFSSLDYFRLKGKFQIGISRKQLLKFHKDFTAGNVFYGIWIGWVHPAAKASCQELEDYGLYIIPMKHLMNTECHTWSHPKNNKEFNFYDIDFIVNNSAQKFRLPIDPDMAFYDHVKPTVENKENELKRRIKFSC